MKKQHAVDNYINTTQFRKTQYYLLLETLINCLEVEN